MNLKPLNDRVVVKRPEVQEELRGGLVVPETAREKPLEAEVVAVGEGKLLENGARAPLKVKVGDWVLLGKYSGTEITVDDQEYSIVREDEILGVLEGKTAGVVTV